MTGGRLANITKLHLAGALHATSQDLRNIITKYARENRAKYEWFIADDFEFQEWVDKIKQGKSWTRTDFEMVTRMLAECF